MCIQQINKAVANIRTEYGGLEIRDAKTMTNFYMPNMKFIIVTLTYGYSMICAVDKKSSNLIKHTTLYTRYINSLSNLQKIDEVLFDK